MVLRKYKLLIELFFFWVFPFCGLWYSFNFITKAISSEFASFLIVFPALTMYLVVGIGAGYCKFWYFVTSYTIKGVLPTIGLLYSAVMNLVTCLLLHYLVEGNNGLFVFLIALIGSLSGTFIDIFLLGSGLFYLKSKEFKIGSNPVKHAISYGIVFFGLAGFVNALGVNLGYYELVVLKNWNNGIILSLTLAPIFALPFISYFLFLLKRNKAHKIAIKN